MRTCWRWPRSTPTRFRSSSGSSTGRPPAGRASRRSGNVSLFYEGKTFRAFAGGNGPVDALLSAVDNALEQIIGGRPQLIDYQLRSIGSGEDAQGEATVKISAPAGDGDVPQVFTGHGLSTNVVEASLRAYLAAVNKLIAEHPVAADAVAAARQKRNPSDPVPTPAGSHP